METRVEGDQSARVEQPGSAGGRLSALVGGAALGLLVGTILGLSINPLSASVMGSLLALLAGLSATRSTLVGEAPSKGGSAGGSVPLHLVGFALACALVLPPAIYTRTHGLLSPSPRILKAKWTDAKFSEEAAEALVVLELGLGEGAVDPGVPGKSGEVGRGAALQGVLFSQSAQACDDVLFLFRSGASVERLEVAFQEGGPVWRALLATAGEQGEGRRAALERGARVLCEGEEEP